MARPSPQIRPNVSLKGVRDLTLSQLTPEIDLGRVETNATQLQTLSPATVTEILPVRSALEGRFLCQSVTVL
jgi:hypothetical protein